MFVYFILFGCFPLHDVVISMFMLCVTSSYFIFLIIISVLSIHVVCSIHVVYFSHNFCVFCALIVILSVSSLHHAHFISSLYAVISTPISFLLLALQTIF